MQYSLPNSTVKLFFLFFKPHKIKVSSFILLCLFFGVTPSIDSILLQKIINVIENSSSDHTTNLLQTMFIWAVGYGLWWETLNCFWRLYDYLYLNLMPVVKGTIIEEIYDYTQRQQHNFFQANIAGNIANRISEGARSFEIIFSTFTENILRRLATIIFALATMLSVHYIFALIFLTWIIFFSTLSLAFSTRISKYSTDYASNKSHIAGKIVDAIANVASIRIFASHNFERKYLKKYLTATIDSDQKMQWFMLKLKYFLGLSCSVMIFAIIYYIATLRSKLLINTGDCVLIITLCIAVASDVWSLSQDIGDVFEEIGVFNQSVSLIKPYTISDSKTAQELKISNGEISFKDVTFYFNDDNKLFKNKSVIIPGKQKIGLVGFSGSGKSTFVNLISRLYDVEHGAILIDGQNIKDVTLSSLHNSISIIPQEPILFHRSVRDNIAYGKESASHDEIIRAAKLAHIHETIQNLPKGYDTLCGERGKELSGGQRQRVAIARAILRNAPILILDEATSSLDSNTENLIQDSLHYLMQNKTVIIVAHKLTTLLDMERIIVFDKGTIVADGTHEELIKNSDLYLKLWQFQVKGLIP